MRKIYRAAILAAAMLFAAACGSTASVQSNQTHGDHDSHTMKVNEQGDKVMGFSHEKTTHHFRLLADGGAIKVTANDPNDAESRDQIRKHLSHIAGMFSEGNFNAPVLTHGKTPPGVPALQQLKDRVKYQYEEIERGGRVRITTTDKDALAAVYEFLRFQISDHQTGDSTEISKE